MPRWTRAQVEQFAPDDKSVKAALKLARPGPWSDTGSTDTLVWGKCQGSGKTPYQVSVDLTGPAAKCTCPSRKFPCKHGVALLMLWVEGDGAVGDTTQAADFASDWAQGRADKAATRSASVGEAPADPEAAAKRLAKRLALMTAGAAEFETWLGDLYRKGLAAARHQSYEFWENPASRLVDSQLPGLAQRVRDISGSLYGDDWADVLITETGRWFTAVTAWQRREELPEADLANLRVFLGWPVPADEVVVADAIADTWTIEGLHRTEDGRLKSQRTWLRGTTTQQRALLLDLAASGAFLDAGHVVGSCVTASLAHYPGSGIRRGRFVDAPVPAESAPVLAEPGTVAEAADDLARQLSTNPFVDELPVCLRARVVAFEHGDAAFGVAVVDADGGTVGLVDEFEPWQLLALTGTDEVSLFGELGLGSFRPLTVEIDGELIPL